MAKTWLVSAALRTAVIAAVAISGSAVAQYRQLPNFVSPQAIQQAGVAQRLLAAHNLERRAMSVQPLAWDPQLAQSAGGHARQLAATGVFEHSDRRFRRGVGENLWMGTRGAFSPEHMIGNWASEKRWYQAGTFPHVSRTGRWDQVAHYTQMIWSGTTKIGCAIATGGGRDFLVCHYSPGGNVDGRPVT
jgi:hypothetical protein